MVEREPEEIENVTIGGHVDIPFKELNLILYKKSFRPINRFKHKPVKNGGRGNITILKINIYLTSYE